MLGGPAGGEGRGGEGAGVGVKVVMVMVVEEEQGRVEAVSVSPPSSIESGRCVRLSLSLFLLDSLAVVVVVCRVSFIVQ